jgi:hypothetical protein
MVRKPLKRLAKGYPTNLHICLRAQKNRLRFVNNINLNWALVAHNYLATQEAEIRRIQVGSQPWANSLPDPISKITKAKWTGSTA